jgi:hypothetical protein
VVARSEAGDDILVRLDDDGTWALVHLTWRRARERTQWPRTVIFSTLVDAAAAMLE